MAVDHTKPTIRFDKLKELSNADATFYREMLESFLSSSKDGITELYKLLGNDNYSELVETAHRLRSPCRHLQCTTNVGTSETY